MKTINIDGVEYRLVPVEKEIQNKEILFWTNDSEVYFDAKNEPVYEGEEYWFITPKERIAGAVAGGVQSYGHPEERFSSEQAAKDYLILQEAVKESGLNVGDEIKEGVDYFCSKWTRKESIGSNPLATEIEGFIISRNKPCAFDTNEDSTYFYPLSQFAKPKLTFGRSNVLIKGDKVRLQGLSSWQEEGTLSELKAIVEECERRKSEK